MKKTKRLKRLYNQLKDYLPLISIVLSILSISLSSIAFLESQRTLRVTESWRDALSRSLEVISEGKVRPVRRDDNWGVSYKEKPNVGVNFQVSASVVFIKGNSTLEIQQANATGN